MIVSCNRDVRNRAGVLLIPATKGGTSMADPTPDLFDICVVLNEATDARLGTNLLPYAERVKAIVIDALIAEIDAEVEALKSIRSSMPEVDWAETKRQHKRLRHAALILRDRRGEAP